MSIYVLLTEKCLGTHPSIKRVDSLFIVVIVCVFRNHVSSALGATLIEANVVGVVVIPILNIQFHILREGLWLLARDKVALC